MISEPELENLAKLARINLPIGERRSLVKDIGKILDYIDQLKEAATQNLQVESWRNILRDDVSPHAAGAHTSELLAAAAKTKDGYIEVKTIWL